MDDLQQEQIDYKFYPGEYPVVIFDLSHSALHITEISKVLNSLVAKHQLEFEKTIWLLYHPGQKWDEEIFDYDFCWVHDHFGQLHFTSRMEKIPQILFQALMSRCRGEVKGSMQLPTHEEWQQRRISAREIRNHKLGY